MAFVKCGNTSGSLSIGKQDMGPLRRYWRRNIFRASLRSPSSTISSIRFTVSGERIPCAVRKEGSVSQEARTDWDSLTVVFRCSPIVRVAPAVLSIFCAVILAVSEVGVLGGTYMVIGGRWEETRRDRPVLGDHAATDIDASAKNRHLRRIMLLNWFMVLVFKVECFLYPKQTEATK